MMFGLLCYYLFVSMQAKILYVCLTCDLPNCAKYIQFFWVQSLNVVIYISVDVDMY